MMLRMEFVERRLQKYLVGEIEIFGPNLSLCDYLSKVGLGYFHSMPWRPNVSNKAFHFR